jgi:hypothetical protein
MARLHHRSRRCGALFDPPEPGRKEITRPEVLYNVNA